MANKVTAGIKLNEIKKNVVNLISETVKSTMGPAGKCVLVDQGYSSKMTKDGVSVAKAIELLDNEENAIAKFFKTAASHTVEQAGDGTTTSIVLAASIFNHAMKGIVYDANSVEIKKGIDEAVSIGINSLESLKMVVADDYEKIKQVAVVSANGDEEIGELITEAFKKIGVEGVITIEEGKSRDHELTVVEGMQFDRGYISPYFKTNEEKSIAELENPYILIYDKKISSFHLLLPILKSINEVGRSLLIIAEDVDGEALNALALNKLRGSLKVAAVKAPGFGDRKKELCQDIAVLTGGTFINEEMFGKLDEITIDLLGQASRVVITSKDTTIIDGKGDSVEIKQRVSLLKHQLDIATSDYDKEKISERIAKLAGGVAVLKVGGMTEEAAKECKDRVDDAVQAVKAAISEGIVPGGTVSLLFARNAIKKYLNSNKLNSDKKIGYDSVIAALETPLNTILENAGRNDFAVVLDNIDKAQSNNDNNYGLNVRTNIYGNLVEMGVIDPLKVLKCALYNASSVAGMLLISESMISSLPEKDSVASAMPGMM